MGRYMLWGRRATANPRPRFASPLLKFSSFKNLVKTKISLHNSRINRNRSVFFCVIFTCILLKSIIIVQCYVVAYLYGTKWLIFQFLLSFSLDMGKLAPTLPPHPKNFDEITPLLVSLILLRPKGCL